MLEKDRILKTINEMPDQIDLNELFEKLIVIQKVEKGLEDVRNGNVISIDDLRKEMKGWSR